ncbi:hypothetical protein NQ318_019160 [Aromia moschata]|uniref:Exonuclease domain-containing protein n=1 Tax=Aromia moschata TaxID=1265417 RepID=A0AAV8YSV0_9CUCU|nr:hypothetical protein NQ318_019160 [Aromia moschata]
MESRNRCWNSRPPYRPPPKIYGNQNIKPPSVEPTARAGVQQALKTDCYRPNISQREFERLLQKHLLSHEQMTKLGYPTACSAKSVNQFRRLGGVGQQQRRRAEEGLPTQGPNAKRRTCSRCARDFFTDDHGYVTQEKCCYHWGRAYPAARSARGEVLMEHTCCNEEAGSPGCCHAEAHVWDGLVSGNNGPFRDFVYPMPCSRPPPDGHGVYAVDCEMCYTARGLELAKVTMVGMDGQRVYESFVKPSSEVVDYNTRFSGVTADHLNTDTKTLHQVQEDLIRLIRQKTILVGHGLENDLRALKIVHTNVVDTAVVFPHIKGLPFKRSLKSLAASFLRREIQRGTGTDGHSSYEDAYACMELMLRHVTNEYEKDDRNKRRNY